MKEILTYLKYGFITGLGVSAAFSIWTNFVEDKVLDMKDRIEESMTKE